MPKHVAFVLEQAYGHILPTLGIARELMQRGHRVSYAVSSSFAPAIQRAGAHAIVFDPIDTRTEIQRLAAARGSSYEYDFSSDEVRRQMLESSERRTASSLAQLQDRYSDDRPDVVVHDDCLDVAGRMLAVEWRIARARIHLRVLSDADVPTFADDQIVIVLLPGFFNGAVSSLDERFHFVGFIAEGRNEIARPWQPNDARGPTVLASPTTGLPNQVDFCRLMIQAFSNTRCHVVLSVPGDFDPLSALDANSIGALPTTFRINSQSSHLKILEHCRLFIGQGGPGSTLEALYSGVPAILIPPTKGHDAAALRVARLGLGLRLSIPEATPDHLRECALALMRDSATLARVKEAQLSMRADRGAKTAADLIEGQIN